MQTEVLDKGTRAVLTIHFSGVHENRTNPEKDLPFNVFDIIVFVFSGDCFTVLEYNDPWFTTVIREQCIVRVRLAI